MGSATTRRFALVAAVVVLAPLWCRAVSDVGAPARSDGPFVGMTAAATAPALVVRRHASAWPWAPRSSPQPSHGPATAGLAALVALLALSRRAPFAAVPVASPLSRRRHVIALRGPPGLPFPSSS